MKQVFLAAAVLFMAVTSEGFQAYNDTQDLGLFNKVKCGADITCSKQKDKLVIGSGLEKQVASSAVTLTSSQCGSTFVMSGHTMTLPLATAALYGCEYTFTNLTGTNLVNPDDLNIIYGLTNAGGDAISNATAGNSVTLQLVGASGWNPISIYGTWSDAN